MTPTEEQVERVARAIYEAGIPKGGRNYAAWDDLDSEGFYAQHDLAMKQAKAALAALPPQDGWQDIATAPRDGTPLLLGSTEWQTVWRGYYLCEHPPGEPDHRWQEHGPRWQRAGMVDTNLHPTHWRPLPPPPAAELERALAGDA